MSSKRTNLTRQNFVGSRIPDVSEAIPPAIQPGQRVQREQYLQNGVTFHSHSIEYGNTITKKYGTGLALLLPSLPIALYAGGMMPISSAFIFGGSLFVAGYGVGQLIGAAAIEERARDFDKVYSSREVVYENVVPVKHQASMPEQHYGATSEGLSDKEFKILASVSRIGGKLTRDQLSQKGFKNLTARWGRGEIQSELIHMGYIDKDHIWQRKAVDYLRENYPPTPGPRSGR